MTNKELQEKLKVLKKKIKYAHEIGDNDSIDAHVTEMNILWDAASKEMAKNAEKDGLSTSDTPTKK